MMVSWTWAVESRWMRARHAMAEARASVGIEASSLLLYFAPSELTVRMSWNVGTVAGGRRAYPSRPSFCGLKQP